MQNFEYKDKKYKLDIKQSGIEELNRIETNTRMHEQKINTLLETNEKGEKIVKIVHPYEKYISMFMEEFRQAYDEDVSDSIEELLKDTSNMLEAIDPEYQKELDHYYGGEKFYIKRRTELNLEVHDFINKPGNEVFKKYSKEYVDKNHLNIDIDIDKAIKESPADFEKIKSFKPIFSEKYKDTLINLFSKFGEYEMFGDFNDTHDESEKKYAGVHLINARRKMIEFFAPDSNEISTFDTKTPEEKQAFFRKKVEDFDKNKLFDARALYKKEKENYIKLLEIAKRGLNNEDCAGNLDVFRNVYEDATITKEPIASTALSSALYMYKMIRKLGLHTEGKDPKEEAIKNLKLYFEDPNTLFRINIKKEMTQFSSDNFKNMKRGEAIYNFGILASSLTNSTFTSNIERFKECETRINPDQSPEFTLASQINQDLLFAQMGSLSRKYQTLFDKEDNLTNLIKRVAMLDDKDFNNPKNIAFSEYLENGNIVSNIDLDQYFTLNCVAGSRVFNNLNVIIDQISEIHNREGSPYVGIEEEMLAVSIQKIATDMIINHYYELTKEDRKDFMKMVENPKKFTSKTGLVHGDLDLNRTIDERKIEFKNKVIEVENKEKAFNKFEKSFVKEENKFNKNYKKVLSKLEEAKNKNIEADIAKYENELNSMREAEVAKLNNYYQNNKLPTSYVFERIDNLYKDEVKEVKGIFKTSGYSNSYDYCQALLGEDANDLSKEEEEIIYRRDLQEKCEFIREGTNEKINLNKEVERVTTRQEMKEASQLALQQALEKTFKDFDINRPKSKPVTNNEINIELNNEISTSVKKK